MRKVFQSGTEFSLLIFPTRIDLFSPACCSTNTKFHKLVAEEVACFIVRASWGLLSVVMDGLVHSPSGARAFSGDVAYHL